MIQAQEFFKAIYEHTTGLVELRPLPGRGEFVPHDCYEDKIFKHVVKFLDRNKARQNYFGVATRDGRGGRKSNIVEIPALWCDVDFKETSADELKKQSESFPFKPSIIVHTGGGYHLYWCLHESAPKEDIPIIEDVNRRIAVALGGDTNSVDAARILRVPGTVNHKYPKTVEVLRLTEFRYNLDDFLETLPEPPVEAKAPDPRTDLAQVVEKLFRCRFLLWCYDNQPQVPEPLWYAMISNVGRVSPGGVSLCHSFSEKHPGYNRAATDAKILHALDSSGPTTCAYIRENGFKECGTCKGKTPITFTVKRF